MDELYRQTARQQVSTQKGYRIGFSIPLGVSAYLCDPLSQETPISFLFLATLERMLWVGVGWAHPSSSVLTGCKEEYGILGLLGIENGRERKKKVICLVFVFLSGSVPLEDNIWGDLSRRKKCERGSEGPTALPGQSTVC